jgi:small subunit ribosomal protein S1
MVALPPTKTSPLEAPPDEGWWSSLLADETRQIEIHEPARPAPQPNANDPVTEWNYARGIYKNDEIVALTVTGSNRGGLLVSGDKIHGFVPYSHLVDVNVPAEGEREAFLAAYVGREMQLKIIECVSDENRVVFSERAARSESGCRVRLFSELKTGQHISGEVTNVTEFGAFVDLGGVEGLIHISELSWGRVQHPAHIVQIGQKLTVQVLDVTPERCRIALSLKRMHPNPWLTATERYPLDSIANATVSTVVSFGLFARLEEGMEGLVHLSEIPVASAAEMRAHYAPGTSVQVRILQLDSSRQRLGLSLKVD